MEMKNEWVKDGIFVSIVWKQQHRFIDMQVLRIKKKNIKQFQLFIKWELEVSLYKQDLIN